MQTIECLLFFVVDKAEKLSHNRFC